MKVKCDHRSEFSNLSNWKVEAWKRSPPTIQPYLIFTKYYARNNPFSIPQNACMKVLKKHLFSIAYQRSPNLRDLLFRAKPKRPSTASQPNHSFGTFRCNSKHGCLTCPHIDNERTNYTFSNAGKVWEIKRQMTCKSTSLIYMTECKRCKKQYIGETKRTLRERFTAEHR